MVAEVSEECKGQMAACAAMTAINIALGGRAPPHCDFSACVDKKPTLVKRIGKVAGELVLHGREGCYRAGWIIVLVVLIAVRCLLRRFQGRKGPVGGKSLLTTEILLAVYHRDGESCHRSQGVSEFAAQKSEQQDGAFVGQWRFGGSSVTREVREVTVDFLGF